MTVDVDRALARAQADIDRDEPWKARRRLRTLVFQKPFEPRFAAMLAELELRRGELPEAGRFLWMVGSDAPEHARAIDVFLAEAGPSTLRRTLQQLWSALGAEEQLPERVVRDLRERGIDAVREREKLQSRAAKRSASASRPSTITGMLGVALILVLVSSMVIGLLSIGKWLVEALG